MHNFLVASVGSLCLNSNLWFVVAFKTFRWNQWAIFFVFYMVKLKKYQNFFFYIFCNVKTKMLTNVSKIMHLFLSQCRFTHYLRILCGCFCILFKVTWLTCTQTLHDACVKHKQVYMFMYLFIRISIIMYFIFYILV